MILIVLLLLLTIFSKINWINFQGIFFWCRYVPMFGDTDYDCACSYSAVSIEEQLQALSVAVKEGKVVFSPFLLCSVHLHRSCNLVLSASYLSALRVEMPQARSTVKNHKHEECVALQIRNVGVSNETAFGLMEFCRLAEQNSSLPRICTIQVKSSSC